MRMATQLIHDRGRGPEISGTRITVYTLLPHFLDPDATEAFICRLYELKAEQVGAARAYILNNPDVVLGKYLLLEAKMTAENPPQVVERAKETRATLLSFKKWLAQRESAELQEQAAEAGPESGRTDSGKFPTFKEWLAERESRSGEGP
jgi:uncharacterized protein (DUF433 family)